MDFTTETKNGIAVIKINVPKATMERSKDFKEYLNREMSTGQKRIIIDMTDVNFIDSSFLATLVSGLKNIMGSKGDIKILGLQSPVRAMFELTRLYKVFEIFNTEQDALASY